MRRCLFTVMSELLVIAALLAPVSSFALGGYGTLAGDDKIIADAIKDKLEISDDDAYQVYTKYIKSQLDTKDWSYDAYTNDSLSSSKVGGADVKFYFINMITDNRFVNITLQKFAKQRQVLIQTIETLPRTSQAAVDKAEEVKKDKQFITVADRESFTTFRKDGYTDKIKLLTFSGAGAIQYIDFGVYDLK